MTKAEKTSKFIIATVAPIFNKKGYAGTSLSDLTKATGLTKGALYGNFKNKETLAIAAYQYGASKLINKIKSQINTSNSSIQQLFILSSFYRYYDSYMEEFGGCPIINASIDTYGKNDFLKPYVLEYTNKLTTIIAEIIIAGKQNGEIKFTINPESYAQLIIAMLKGATLLAMSSNNNDYLSTMVSHLERLINKELKA